MASAAHFKRIGNVRDMAARDRGASEAIGADEGVPCSSPRLHGRSPPISISSDEYPTVLGEDEDSADTEFGVGQAAVSSDFFGAAALTHAIPSPMTAIGLTTPPSSGGGVRHTTGIAIGFAAPVID